MNMYMNEIKEKEYAKQKERKRERIQIGILINKKNELLWELTPNSMNKM